MSSIERGASNWARSMRRAARRAEEGAQTWERNYRIGIADGSAPASPSAPAPSPPPSSFGNPAADPVTDDLVRKTIGCFCDNALPLGVGKQPKKDDTIVCTDAWVKYLTGQMELDQLEKTIDGYFGEGTFRKVNEQSRRVCPL